MVATEATSELPEIDQKELYEYLNRDRAASRIQQFWRMKALGFDAARIAATNTCTSSSSSSNVGRTVGTRRGDGDSDSGSSSHPRPGAGACKVQVGK